MAVSPKSGARDITSFRLQSFYTKSEYIIHVYIPNKRIPVKGFPIYYVLEGPTPFDLFNKAVYLQSLKINEDIENAIVIGICHNEKTMFDDSFYDFTAPAEKYHYPKEHVKKPINKHGGAEQFHSFIEEELKPRIEVNFPVDVSKQALVGYSLGGYYALWYLFTHSDNYQSYLAMNPAIWWNNKELLQYAEKFITQIKDLKTRLFLSIDKTEKNLIADVKYIFQTLQKRMPVQYHIATDDKLFSTNPASKYFLMQSLFTN